MCCVMLCILNLLQEDPEAKFAEAERVKFEKETEKEEQDKDKPKRKKTLKADEGDEAGAATKTAKGAVPYSIVETELPIAALDEDEEALVMKDIRHRAPLSTEALPSCLMFTFVNTHQVISRKGFQFCFCVADDGWQTLTCALCGIHYCRHPVTKLCSAVIGWNHGSCWF